MQRKSAHSSAEDRLRNDAVVISVHGIEPEQYLEAIPHDARRDWEGLPASRRLEKKEQRLTSRVEYHRRRREAHAADVTAGSDGVDSQPAARQTPVGFAVTSLGTLALLAGWAFLILRDAWSGDVSPHQLVVPAVVSVVGSMLLSATFFCDDRLPYGRWHQALVGWGLPILGALIAGLLLARTPAGPYMAAALTSFLAVVILAGSSTLRSLTGHAGPAFARGYRRLVQSYHAYREDRIARRLDMVGDARAALERELEALTEWRRSVFLRAYELAGHWPGHGADRRREAAGLSGMGSHDSIHTN